MMIIIQLRHLLQIVLLIQVWTIAPLIRRFLSFSIGVEEREVEFVLMPMVFKIFPCSLHQVRMFRNHLYMFIIIQTVFLPVIQFIIHRVEFIICPFPTTSVEPILVVSLRMSSIQLLCQRIIIKEGLLENWQYHKNLLMWTMVIVITQLLMVRLMKGG